MYKKFIYNCFYFNKFNKSNVLCICLRVRRYYTISILQNVKSRSVYITCRRVNLYARASIGGSIIGWQCIHETVLPSSAALAREPNTCAWGDERARANRQAAGRPGRRGHRRPREWRMATSHFAAPYLPDFAGVIPVKSFRGPVSPVLAAVCVQAYEASPHRAFADFSPRPPPATTTRSLHPSIFFSLDFCPLFQAFYCRRAYH